MSQVVIKGIVRDSVSKEGIPYVNIISLSNEAATYTNEKGLFELKTKKTSADTIKVSSIGYKPLYICTASFSHKDTIFMEIKLKEMAFDLNEITVTKRINTKKEIHKLGFYDAKKKYAQTIATVGCQYSLYIPNTLGEEGIIEKIKVKFIKLPKLPDACTYVDIRIRVYAPDKTGSPGEDLLRDNILISPISGGYIINIRKHNIIFPLEGVFIGVEWVDTNNRTQGKSKTVGPGLKWAYDNIEQFQTWANFKGKWSRHKLRFSLDGYKKYYSAMIGIDVSTF